MSRITTAAVAAMAAFALGAPARAAVSASSANVFSGATATIVTATRFNPKEKDKQATLGANAKSVNAAVSVVNQDAAGDRAFDHEDVFANFTGPTGGTVTLTGDSTSSGVSPANIVEAYNSGSSFDYDFTLTSSYTFNVTYFLSETDNFYSDNYYQLISTSGGPPIFSGSPVDGTFAVPTTGSASALLGPGSYEFGVTTQLGDISGVQGPGVSSGAHADQYAFSLVSAAPEPAAWALMIAGLAGVGYALRRARTRGFKLDEHLPA